MRKYSAVKRGSTGTDVIVLQTVLRTMQYLGKNGKLLNVTGTADENTVYAINTFQTKQRACGYECGAGGKNDGNFGTKCWNRLVGGQ